MFQLPGMIDLTAQDAWVTNHPYLRPVAAFHTQLRNEMIGIASEHSELPRWDDYICDYLDGVPILRSSAIAIELLPA